jgi:type II secretory pathway component GspD/PulD (secretin)
MSFRIRFRAAVVSLGLASSIALLAPGRARADGPASDDVQIKIDAGFSVPEFLKTVADASKRQILWSPDDHAVTTKKFASAAVVRVPANKVLEAARALLVPLEIVLVPLDAPGLSSFYAMDMRTLASQFVLRLKPEPVVVDDTTVRDLEKQDGLFVTAVVRVENLDNLRDARQALQRLVTQNNVGSVQEIPVAKAFLVTDFAPNVAAVYRAVRLLDVPRPADPAVVREFFVLKRANASKVRAILEEQFSTRVARPTNPNEPPPTPSDSEPRISADDETHQVIVTCRDKVMASVREVVTALDREPK